MIKKSLLVITAAISFTSAAQATSILLASSRSSPTVVTSADATVAGGLIRVGMISDLAGISPASSFDEIAAVFTEFGTGVTSDVGRPGGNPAIADQATATPFNGQQVYIWVFSDGAGDAGSAQHGLFTNNAAPPSAGDPWQFPAFGPPTDGATLSMVALSQQGVALIGGLEDGKIILAPTIPEPSGALLAGLAGMVFLFRRRR